MVATLRRGERALVADEGDDLAVGRQLVGRGHRAALRRAGAAAAHRVGDGLGGRGGGRQEVRVGALRVAARGGRGGQHEGACRRRAAALGLRRGLARGGWPTSWAWRWGVRRLRAGRGGGCRLGRAAVVQQQVPADRDHRDHDHREADRDGGTAEAAALLVAGAARHRARSGAIAVAPAVAAARGRGAAVGHAPAVGLPVPRAARLADARRVKLGVGVRCAPALAELGLAGFGLAELGLTRSG